MSLKDMLTLVNVRKDLRFFIHRLLIGLALSVTFSANMPHMLTEIEAKKLELLLILLSILIPMYVIYRFKPTPLFFKRIQKECILFCVSLTSIIRSTIIVGISALLFNVLIWNEPITAFVYIVNFLIALETITNAQYGLDGFEYDSDDSQEWVTIIVAGKDDHSDNTDTKY
ncbi:MAG: hypothetical protein RBR41_02470 [Desulfovibrio sp.]|uniref:hypothetical protein n=1 Tax=Desulfovibrio sp. TaxID=885 RepID=UPI002A36B5DB|nr:hypothetical protein [Desulfovibrio sp.]MDY0258516.1 hypothetical protein [Desulfovibrio sp.]